MKLRPVYLFLALSILCLILPIAFPDKFTPKAISGIETAWGLRPAAAWFIYFGIGILVTTFATWLSVLSFLKDYRATRGRVVSNVYRVVLSPNSLIRIGPIKGCSGSVILRISIVLPLRLKSTEIEIEVAIKLEGEEKSDIGSLVYSADYAEEECETVVLRQESWTGSIELQNNTDNSLDFDVELRVWFPSQGRIELPMDAE